MGYLVTFCSFDMQAGSNPFWHNALLISKIDTHTQKIEVLSAWGFYGVSSTSTSILRHIKRKVGLDIDLWGNHGWLVREEIRYMDKGLGLYGDTYALSIDEFNELQQELVRRLQEQDEAVAEATKALNLSPLRDEFKYYPAEENSARIFAWEKDLAVREFRKSRLKPFDFQVSWDLWCPSLKNSHTCKTEAIHLLEHALPQQDLRQYQRWTFPRFISRYMEPIQLYSEGPSLKHRKNNGTVIHYRQWQPDVKLFWTVPPQKIISKNSEIYPNNTLDRHYSPQVRAAVKTLQRLEHLILNGKLDNSYHFMSARLENYRAVWVNKIREKYQEFSVVKNQPKMTPRVTLLGKMNSWLFNLPRNQQQQQCHDYIEAIKNYFNDIYILICDKDLALSATEENIDNYLELMVLTFEVGVQKEICSLLGRTYLTTAEEPPVQTTTTWAVV